MIDGATPRRGEGLPPARAAIAAARARTAA